MSKPAPHTTRLPQRESASFDLPHPLEAVGEALTDPLALAAWLNAPYVSTGPFLPQVFEIQNWHVEPAWAIRGLVHRTQPGIFMLVSSERRLGTAGSETLLEIRLSSIPDGTCVEVTWFCREAEFLVEALSSSEARDRLAAHLESPLPTHLTLANLDCLVP